MIKKKLTKGEKLTAKGYIYGHRYRLICEISMSELTKNPKFYEHRRLKVFANKGCTCVNCGVVGVKFLLCEDQAGSYHHDIYTVDNILMTIDHVLSQAKGGSNELDNLVPMCTTCNGIKGRTEDMVGLKEYQQSINRANNSGE